MDFYLECLLNLLNTTIEKCTEIESEVHLELRWLNQLISCKFRGFQTDEINQLRPLQDTKYLILKNGTELDKKQSEQVEQILGYSKRLREAFALKESFRDIYQTHQTPEEARIQIQDWIW